jgi:ABC-2 type transport system permease protein
MSALDRVISRPLLRQTWRANRVRVAILAVALATWGLLMPIIYASFGREVEALLTSGMIPDSVLQIFTRFMGSDPFSLDGAVALGAVHPIAIAMQAVYPVGFAAAAIAGERQRGTLEVLLSRPVSRRAIFLTLLLAMIAFATITTVAQLAGTVVAAIAWDVAGQLDAGAIVLLGVNTVAFLSAMAAISLAASASFDRLGPALGVSFGVLILAYVLDILGTLWPSAAWLQPYSPFHYLRPLEILGGRGEVSDVAVLVVLGVVAAAFGLWRFPRRDIAAPA